jgi:hypothetical protein
MRVLQTERAKPSLSISLSESRGITCRMFSSTARLGKPQIVVMMTSEENHLHNHKHKYVAAKNL